MRILFLNPPHRFKISRSSRWPEKTKSGTLYYPYWLAYATGVAFEKGHDVLLVDAISKKSSFDKTKNVVLKFNPKLLVVDTSTPTIKNDIEFIDFLKNKGFKGKIVVVGTHPSALPEETLKMSKNIDFIARGEYDHTIPDLAENLDKPEKVLGISYRSRNRIVNNKNRSLVQDLNKIPFVSKTYKKFLDINDYFYAFAKKPMIQILSSRGCPNRCTFCSYPQTFEGRNFRARSAENLVAELEYIKKELPEIKEIFIEDDTFTVNRGRVNEICDLIIKKKLNITWSVNVRADVPFELLKKMKKAGCRLLVVGYESGNQTILNNVKKGITIKMSEEFTKNAKKAGLRIFGCFMIGLPGENMKTIKDTFNLAKKLNPDMVFFQQAVPFPGTEFYEWCKQNKYLITEDYGKWLDSNGQLGFLVNYPSLSNKQIEKTRDSLMLRFYLSPKHSWQTIVKNRSYDEIGRLLIASFSYFRFLFNKRTRKK